jgi:hypothetical protein
MADFIRMHPACVGRVLRDFMSVAIQPGAPIGLVPGGFDDGPPWDLLPDEVILVGAKHDPERIVIVEVQQDRNEGRRRLWAQRAAACWLRYDRPVDVLVICPDMGTAEWCARPFCAPLSGYTHRPLVLHPELVPAITRAGVMAADPGIAVLSMAYHGFNRDVAKAFVEGMLSLGAELGESYYQHGYRIASGPVRTTMEELVAAAFTQGSHSEFFAGLCEHAREAGRAEALAELRREVERAPSTQL